MSQREENNNSSDEKAELIKWFSEIKKDSESIAGTKGANLAEIYNIHFPVPPGFIITTKAYEYFLENSPGLNEKIKGLLDKINHQNTQLLNDICDVIKNSIIETDMPAEMEEEILDAYESLGAEDLSEVYGSALDILQNAQEPSFVAVRSSKTEEEITEKQESFLNIKGNSQLLTHIKKCFASLFTPEAISFRYKNGVSTYPVPMAVIIQKMIDSDKSGVIFSEDKDYEDKIITINSIWGLGEGISSGLIAADKYSVNRNLEIINVEAADKEIAITRDSSGNKTAIKLREEKSKQPSLTKKEVLKLSELAIKIEEYYKKPQIIEFCIEGNDIYVVETKELKDILKNKESKMQEISNKKEPKLKEEISEKEIKPVNSNTKTKINILIDSPKSAEKASKTNLKIVGLAKIEKIIAESGKHPDYYIKNEKIKEYEEIIFKGINQIAQYFDEIWIRTSDILNGEYPNLESSQKESNPLLGLHGIRYSLKNPEIFEAELNALKRITESGKEIGILLPQITSTEEIHKVKEILNKIEIKNIKLGVIIETPAAVQIISQICDEEIDSIFIETDDLTQYMLAIDKRNNNVKELYNEMNPAITYQLAYLLRVCRRRNVKSNVSWEKGGKKEIIKFLIENGIGSITVDAEDAYEIEEYVKEVEENIVKGTDKEPRKYNPKSNSNEEFPPIKGVEKLHEPKNQQ